MRRLLVLFLLLFLPLSNSFAVAAACCQHEKTQSSAHVGHHAHQHQADKAAPDAGDEGRHADCSYCHLVCAMAVTTSTFLTIAARYSGIALGAGAERFTSAAADALYRPPTSLRS